MAKIRSIWKDGQSVCPGTQFHLLSWDKERAVQAGPADPNDSKMVIWPSDDPLVRTANVENHKKHSGGTYVSSLLVLGQ